MNIKRTALALLSALLLAGAARAEGTILQTNGEAERRIPVEIYVAEGALDRETASEAAGLLGQVFEQGEFTVIHESDAGSLRELVMAGRAPQVAVCAPQEAMPWASEGLLAPLDGRVEDLTRMQPEIVEACVLDETLYMAPLRSDKRRLAVNARLVHAVSMGSLLDPHAYPVWYPAQLNLLLEELALSDIPAMDVWLADAQMQEGAALEALLQALYGATLLPADEGWDGSRPAGLLSAVQWLEEMTDSGFIALSGSRQEALDRFLDGETALFIDWRDEDERLYADRLRSNGVELAVVEYPSSTGMPVRAWELTAAAAFIGDDAAQTALSMEAAAFLCGDAGAQRLLGARGIWRDDAIWLRCLSVDARGATLRVLFAQALRGVLLGDLSPETGINALYAVLRALR